MRRKHRFDRADDDARGVGRGPGPSVARIVEVASRQHAVITRRQLLDLGLGPRAIDRRLAARQLTRLHRGVYLLGVAVLPLTRPMAAVLACGDGAVLSHHSAAHLHQLLPRLAQPRPAHVSIGSRPGLQARNSHSPRQTPRQHRGHDA